MVRPTGFEPVTFGSGDKAPEFHNLLKISKLLKQRDFHLAGFF